MAVACVLEPGEGRVEAAGQDTPASPSIPRLRWQASPIGAGDRWWALAFALIAAALSGWGLSHIDARIYGHFDIWFQADPPRVLANMSEREGHWQNATFAHPVFPILSYAIVHTLFWMGVPALTSVLGLVVASAALGTALLFLTVRALGLPVTAAGALTAAYLASAGFLHWYSFVETFPFAGLSVIAMIHVMVRAPARAGLAWLLVSAATLAVTITNWSMALVAGAARLTWRRFAVAIGGGFLAVLGVAAVQQHFFGGARIFLFHIVGARRAMSYSAVSMSSHGFTWHPLTSFVDAILYPGVVPSPVAIGTPAQPGPWALVTNQDGSFAPLGLVAAAAWLVLIGIGIWGALLPGRRRPLGCALLAFLSGQVLLSTFYGELTFLYVANYTAAAIVLIAFGWFTPARIVAAGALGVFLLCGSVNNGAERQAAARLAKQLAMQEEVAR